MVAKNEKRCKLRSEGEMNDVRQITTWRFIYSCSRSITTSNVRSGIIVGLLDPCGDSALVGDAR